ncbi:hypothetical protein Micbo1qcDRAFT_159048 [Microdochium bolleyi]|uniref:Uncharacterized protein n=1 Tax=Microdochium bolleyi TaxID=196109 RepID=A0A136JA71_9PEZI|nr:hypothetical protein Micbo1qcDRAFT_159048 [Microdochium bolleyi]
MVTEMKSRRADKCTMAAVLLCAMPSSHQCPNPSGLPASLFPCPPPARQPTTARQAGNLHLEDVRPPQHLAALEDRRPPIQNSPTPVHPSRPSIPLPFPIEQGRRNVRFQDLKSTRRLHLQVCSTTTIVLSRTRRLAHRSPIIATSSLVFSFSPILHYLTHSYHLALLHAHLVAVAFACTLRPRRSEAAAAARDS